MDRLFLDANVLYSAAHSKDSRFRELWRLENVSLLTSAYAVEETRRNLRSDEQRERFAKLLPPMEVVRDTTRFVLPQDITLPDKDRPILLAAIEMKATHLLTGDKQHFGAYYGQAVVGVLIMSPAEYLRAKT